MVISSLSIFGQAEGKLVKTLKNVMIDNISFTIKAYEKGERGLGVGEDMPVKFTFEFIRNDTKKLVGKIEKTLNDLSFYFYKVPNSLNEYGRLFLDLSQSIGANARGNEICWINYKNGKINIKYSGETISDDFSPIYTIYSKDGNYIHTLSASQMEKRAAKSLYYLSIIDLTGTKVRYSHFQLNINTHILRQTNLRMGKTYLEKL